MGLLGIRYATCEGISHKQKNITQNRNQCRWFRSHGIVIPSEKRMRECSDDLLGSNLTSELAPFSFPMKHGGEDLRPAPHVYVVDLVQLTLHLLDQYERLVNAD